MEFKTRHLVLDTYRWRVSLLAAGDTVRKCRDICGTMNRRWKIAANFMFVAACENNSNREDRNYFTSNHVTTRSHVRFCSNLCALFDLSRKFPSRDTKKWKKRKVKNRKKWNFSCLIICFIVVTDRRRLAEIPRTGGGKNWRRGVDSRVVERYLRKTGIHRGARRRAKRLQRHANFSLKVSTVHWEFPIEFANTFAQASTPKSKFKETLAWPGENFPPP